MNYKKLLPIILLFLISILFIKNRKSIQIIELGPACTNKKNVTVYHGPSTQTKKAWKLHHLHWPICIIEIKANWVKIQDAYDTIGWIKKIDIKQEKRGLIIKDILINNEILLKKNCIVLITKVKKNNYDIEINSKNFTVNKEYIWPQIT